MSTLQGIGMFLWLIERLNGVDDIVQDALDGQITYILIKVANGTWEYNWDDGIDLVPPLVDKLKRNNIIVWGWHYILGDNPTSEAYVALSRIRQLGLSGYVLNAEADYKEGDKSSAARITMNILRNELGSDFPIALSSYRYPSQHRELPWKEFLNGCNIVMPQVYWMQEHNPAYQLSKTIQEYNNLYTSLNIAPLEMIPTGAAFGEFGWVATPTDVETFLDEAYAAHEFPSCNFWEWHEAIFQHPELWEIIKNYDYGVTIPPIDKPEEVPLNEWALAIDAWARTEGYDGPMPIVEEDDFYRVQVNTGTRNLAVRENVDGAQIDSLPNGSIIKVFTPKGAEVYASGYYRVEIDSFNSNRWIAIAFTIEI